MLAALVRAFAPDFTDSVMRQASSLVTVTVRTNEPEEAPQSPPPANTPPDAEPEGAAAEAGKQARPRPVTAPKPAVPRPDPSPAPSVSSEGPDNASGAAETGEGTGAGGAGQGSGGGQNGSGQGSGFSRRLEKIEGNITSAGDYPRATRDLRRGHDVIIELTVGADGRVTACRVTDPSPDPQADTITCQLASERFRFLPALDAQGNPVVGRYRWRQRWY
ncbi:TonB family protein [Altericroceibacterium spongiae]|uniref:TonB family protein n=2 Tax=Altericroceibacterium spongiae TaxID=2320269 RepID=A0A420EJC9_9SPHN|nr:TonB family protein [Altericroceibacterium spongiae]